jgi:hypothetical protein
LGGVGGAGGVAVGVGVGVGVGASFAHDTCHVFERGGVNTSTKWPSSVKYRSVVPAV